MGIQPTKDRVPPRLVEAATFEDLPAKWQAPILKAEQNLP